MATSELLKALGIGGATIGAGAALHGAGLGQLLTPLDYPRQSLYNLFASPFKAMETGDASHLLGAIPGAAGAVLGGVLGGPLGVLAGSALGGTLQGIGQATGREEFNAPSVQDLTGTEDFLPNLAVGMATDPLSYAGLGASWRAAKGAATPLGNLVKQEVTPLAKAAEAAIPMATHAGPEIPLARLAEDVAYPGPVRAIAETPHPIEPLTEVHRSTYTPFEPENPWGDPLPHAPNENVMMNPNGDNLPPTTHGFHPFNNPSDSIETYLSILEHEGEESAQAWLQRMPPEQQADIAEYKHLLDRSNMDVGMADFWRMEAAAGRQPQLDQPVNLYDRLIKQEGIPQELPQKPGHAPTFYSRLEQAIQGLPDKPMKAESVMNLLNKAPGGVAKEELEWTRMADALAGKKAVTKEDLLNHFKQNEIKVQEVWHGGEGEPKAKYADRTTPGGTNQFELLLTLPERPQSLPEGYSVVHSPEDAKLGRAAYKILDERGKPIMNDMRFDSPENATEQFVHRQGGGKNFTSGHWDEPNVLAHVRMNDRMGPNGEKILHVEEIQSDWHQLGRKGAYEGTERAAYLRGLQKEEASLLELGNRLPVGDPQHARIDARLAEIDKVINIPGDPIGVVPQGPFKDNWHELAMKRVIRYAAENGYERITLNPGEQINKVLGSGEKALLGQAKFYGTNLSETELGDRARRLALDKFAEGNLSPAETKLIRGEMEPAEYGKTIKSQPTVPNWMQKYGKQYGVKVEPHEMAMPAELKSLKDVSKWRELVNAIPDTNERNWAFRTLTAKKDYPALTEILQRNGVSIPPELRNTLPTTSIAPNAKMREQALFKGQPLMSLAPLLAGAGGGPLLAALLGQGERS